MKFGKAFRYFVLVVSAGLFFTLSTFSISYRWQIHQYEERFKKGSLIRAELITKYLSENLDEPCIEALVKGAFRRFLQRNVKQYAHWDSLPIGFNGSIALAFRAPLETVMHEEGMHLGRIIQAPMEGLVDYHKAQQAL